MRPRVGVEPWAGWWNELQTSTIRSAPMFRWWLAGDEEAAATCRQDLLDNPIFRQQPQGYLELSSHHLSDFVAAYDVLASWHQGLIAADHAAIRGKIASEAEYYYEVLESVRGGANYGNQHMLAASALGLATLALAESKWLNRALHEIGREENLCFFRPGAGATAPFALMPNARANPDVSWAPLDGQNIALSGPAWSDIITVEAAELHISGRKGTVSQRLAI